MPSLADLEIPGGWSERTVAVGTHSFTLLLPAEPDAFLEQLEDPATTDQPHLADPPCHQRAADRFVPVTQARPITYDLEKPIFTDERPLPLVDMFTDCRTPVWSIDRCPSIAPLIRSAILLPETTPEADPTAL
jgi:hypothetical protein